MLNLVSGVEWGLQPGSLHDRFRIHIGDFPAGLPAILFYEPALQGTPDVPYNAGIFDSR
jgi:hypothetical protein